MALIWTPVIDKDYMLRVKRRRGRCFAPSVYVGPEGPTPKKCVVLIGDGAVRTKILTPVTAG